MALRLSVAENPGSIPKGFMERLMDERISFDDEFSSRIWKTGASGFQISRYPILSDPKNPTKVEERQLDVYIDQQEHGMVFVLDGKASVQAFEGNDVLKSVLPELLQDRETRAVYRPIKGGPPKLERLVSKTKGIVFESDPEDKPTGWVDLKKIGIDFEDFLYITHKKPASLKADMKKYMERKNLDLEYVDEYLSKGMRGTPREKTEARKRFYNVLVREVKKMQGVRTPEKPDKSSTGTTTGVFGGSAVRETKINFGEPHGEDKQEQKPGVIGFDDFLKITGRARGTANAALNRNGIDRERIPIGWASDYISNMQRVTDGERAAAKSRLEEHKSKIGDDVGDRQLSDRLSQDRPDVNASGGAQIAEPEIAAPKLKPTESGAAEIITPDQVEEVDQDLTPEPADISRVDSDADVQEAAEDLETEELEDSDIGESTADKSPTEQSDQSQTKPKGYTLFEFLNLSGLGAAEARSVIETEGINFDGVKLDGPSVENYLGKVGKLPVHSTKPAEPVAGALASTGETVDIVVEDAQQEPIVQDIPPPELVELETRANEVLSFVGDMEGGQTTTDEDQDVELGSDATAEGGRNLAIADKSDVYRPIKAAKTLGLNEDALQDLVRTGRLVPVTIEGEHFGSQYFKRDDVLRLKAEQIETQTGRKVYIRSEALQVLSDNDEALRRAVRKRTIRTYQDRFFDMEDTNKLADELKGKLSSVKSVSADPTETTLAEGADNPGVLLEQTGIADSGIAEPGETEIVLGEGSQQSIVAQKVSAALDQSTIIESEHVEQDEIADSQASRVPKSVTDDAQQTWISSFTEIAKRYGVREEDAIEHVRRAGLRREGGGYKLDLIDNHFAELGLSPVMTSQSPDIDTSLPPAPRPDIVEDATRQPDEDTKTISERQDPRKYSLNIARSMLGVKWGDVHNILVDAGITRYKGGDVDADELDLLLERRRGAESLVHKEKTEPPKIDRLETGEASDVDLDKPEKSSATKPALPSVPLGTPQTGQADQTTRAPEKSHIKEIASRYGISRTKADNLLREGGIKRHSSTYYSTKEADEYLSLRGYRPVDLSVTPSHDTSRLESLPIRKVPEIHTAPTTTKDTDTFSLGETAELLGMTKPDVMNLVNHHKLEMRIVDGKICFEKSVVEIFGGGLPEPVRVSTVSHTPQPISTPEKPAESVAALPEPPPIAAPSTEQLESAADNLLQAVGDQEVSTPEKGAEASTRNIDFDDSLDTNQLDQGSATGQVETPKYGDVYNLRKASKILGITQDDVTRLIEQEQIETVIVSGKTYPTKEGVLKIKAKDVERRTGRRVYTPIEAEKAFEGNIKRLYSLTSRGRIRRPEDKLYDAEDVDKYVGTSGDEPVQATARGAPATTEGEIGSQEQVGHKQHTDTAEIQPIPGRQNTPPIKPSSALETEFTRPDGKRVYKGRRKAQEVLGCPDGTVGSHVDRSGARISQKGDDLLIDADKLDAYVDQLRKMGGKWKRGALYRAEDSYGGGYRERATLPLSGDSHRGDRQPARLPSTEDTESLGHVAPRTREITQEPELLERPKPDKPMYTATKIGRIYGRNTAEVAHILKEGGIRPALVYWDTVYYLQSEVDELFSKIVRTDSSDVRPIDAGRGDRQQAILPSMKDVRVSDSGTAIPPKTVAPQPTRQPERKPVEIKPLDKPSSPVGFSQPSTNLSMPKRPELPDIFKPLRDSILPRLESDRRVFFGGDKSDLASVLKQGGSIVYPNSDTEFVQPEQIERVFGRGYERVRAMLAWQGLETDPIKGVNREHLARFINNKIDKLNHEIAERMKEDLGYKTKRQNVAEPPAVDISGVMEKFDTPHPETAAAVVNSDLPAEKVVQGSDLVVENGNRENVGDGQKATGDIVTAEETSYKAGLADTGQVDLADDKSSQDKGGEKGSGEDQDTEEQDYQAEYYRGAFRGSVSLGKLRTLIQDKKAADRILNRYGQDGRVDNVILARIGSGLQESELNQEQRNRILLDMHLPVGDKGRGVVEKYCPDIGHVGRERVVAFDSVRDYTIGDLARIGVGHGDLDLIKQQSGGEVPGWRAAEILVRGWKIDTVKDVFGYKGNVGQIREQIDRDKANYQRGRR